MKRTLEISICYLILLGWAASLQAQTLSITVLASQIAVPMSSGTHYESGNTVSVENAIRVSASVTWDLNVKVSGPLTNGAYSIPASSFGIRVTDPIGNVQPERMLSISDQLIVDSAPSTFISLIDFPILLDIAIRATGGTSFLDKPDGLYSTTITYTITAD